MKSLSESVAMVSRARPKRKRMWISRQRRLDCACVIACVATAMFSLQAAHGGTVTTYSATDVGVGPGAATPNASAVAAGFDAAASALAPEFFVDFEPAPIGPFAGLVVAPGVTITGADLFGNDQTILNSPADPSNPALDGFNTTLGGSQFLELAGGSVTFTFANSTEFFGAMFTGIQPEFYTDSLTFYDGTVQNIVIFNPSPDQGGVTFLGFTDTGAAITSITVNAGTLTSGADFFGVDDVRYSIPVPEPNPFASTCSAFLAIVLLARRRR